MDIYLLRVQTILGKVDIYLLRVQTIIGKVDIYLLSLYKLFLEKWISIYCIYL